MPKRILVVDDEEDIREIYRRALEREGFEVALAEEAATAARELKSSHFEVVIADIRMPGMDGIELLELARKEHPDTDVIIATGYPAAETAIQALRLGAFDYIIKPFTIEELLHTVNRCLEHRRLSSENVYLRRIAALYDISRAFSTSMGLKSLLELIADRTAAAVGARGVSVFLLEDGKVMPAASTGAAAATLPSDADEIKKWEGVVQVPENGAVRLFVPLDARGERVGFILTERETADFSAEEEKLLQIFAEQAATAIRDTRLHEELQARLQELQQAYQVLRKTQEQLIQSEKLSAVGELAAGVAHEINNPLATILGTIQVLHEKSVPEEKKSQYFKIMEQQVERMARVISGLLNFARQGEPRFSDLNLNSVIEETLLITEHQLQRTGKIEVVRELVPDLPPVYADQNQVQQVLVNLFLNAAQAMAPGPGTLTVRTRACSTGEGKFVVVEVADTGPGIPKEIQSKIFDPFFTTKEVGRGTGLGLAVAYGIMERHGGKIESQSAEGKGATFVLSFPAGGGQT